MSSSEELDDLRSRTDLTGVPVQKLIAAARQAHERRQADYELACHLIFTLNAEHKLTFVAIGELLGMPHSTAHHMARQFRES